MTATDNRSCSNIMKNTLFSQTERKTNHDSVFYLIILAGIIVLSEILNEVGIFQVSPIVMRLGAAFGAVLYLVPLAVMLLPRFFQSKTDILSEAWFKYFVIAFAWLGTAAACVLLTHHTVSVMAFPIMIMAQYRDTKQLVPITVVLATICVLMGVYGGFLIGCFDANLLHRSITDANAFDLSLRFRLATPARMADLLTHYALPRELVVIALIVLATRISLRNDRMLIQQAQLQSTVEQEMRRTNEIQVQIIDGMANLIENRDTSTGEHVKRTSFYVNQIALTLQKHPKYAGVLNDSYIRVIAKAAPLHDIGKIVVSDRILQKPGRLTPEEYEEIKKHAIEGERVIHNVLGSVEDEEFLKIAAQIAVQHHERWDGKGYPSGLAGEKIALPARIMAVADVFDALVSKRVYKEPISQDEAFDIIESESAKQFDPDVVAAFLQLRPVITKFLKTD